MVNSKGYTLLDVHIKISAPQEKLYRVGNF